MQDYFPWITLVLLGAYHGINPGMGWLFAVALGLQEGNRRGVLRAFIPIALGHAISIAFVVAFIAVAQMVISPMVLRIVGAGALLLFGLYKLLTPNAHPRWVGMRVSFRDLTMWSFLMATAHGAGLMLLPVLLYLAPVSMPAAAGVTHTHADHAAHSNHAAHVAHGSHCSHSDHAAHSAHTNDGSSTNHADHMLVAGTPASMPLAQLAAVGLHTLAMFLAMGGIALVVYEKLGLTILRRAWFNLDRIWAIALIITGALSFVL